MENKKMLMGLGVLALAGYLYYRYDKKQKGMSIMTSPMKGESLSNLSGGQCTCADGKTYYYSGNATTANCAAACEGTDREYKNRQKQQGGYATRGGVDIIPNRPIARRF